MAGGRTPIYRGSELIVRKQRLQNMMTEVTGILSEGQVIAFAPKELVPPMRLLDMAATGQE